ncbi:MAG: Acetyl-coenzyme A carboxylase carboxyl transferase subunit alpha [Chlamydiia bacterium]|nr:Acetyl-coenzyme A carboxylase carboxyl transferase subunit alpha [Chlamydiia bacterium]
MKAQSGVKNKLSAIERVAIARQSSRPKGFDVIKAISSTYEELHGDRIHGDDKALICGVCELNNQRTVFIAQHKGSNAEERKEHNFGMCSPEGFLKAQRMMRLAERFNLPVLTIVDTPGAYPGLDAEKKGQSRAIADNLFEMSALQAPIVSLVLAEGCSGGALGICVSDYILMLEHAYFSVIAPEGCASILWKDVRKKRLAAEQLKMQSEDLLSFGMVDKVIKEGEGFHLNYERLFPLIKSEILNSINQLQKLSFEALLERRYKKYRSF